MYYQDVGYGDNSLERLTRLETLVAVKIVELDKAVILAREIVVKETDTALDTITSKMEELNNYQRRMDALVADTVTKDVFNSLKTTVYFGIGIAWALAFLFPYLISKGVIK